MEHNTYDVWTKRLGQRHYVSTEGSSNTTMCGMPMLGNNYVNDIPVVEQIECPKCIEAIKVLKEGIEGSNLKIADGNRNTCSSLIVTDEVGQTFFIRYDEIMKLISKAVFIEEKRINIRYLNVANVKK